MFVLVVTGVCRPSTVKRLMGSAGLPAEDSHSAGVFRSLDGIAG